MADFLSAVKSVRTRGKGDGDDGLLTALGSRNLRKPSTEIAVETPNQSSGNDDLRDDKVLSSLLERTRHRSSERHTKNQPIQNNQSLGRAETPTEALQILRSRLGLDDLLVVLEQLKSGDFSEPFDLATPGPLQAQITNALLSEIVPTFWPALEAKDANILLPTLQNVAALNAIVARLRLLASQKASGESISDVLDVASRLFLKDDLLLSIWGNMSHATLEVRKHDLLWRELVNLIGSGKVVGAVAQAEDALRSLLKTVKTQANWLASGSEYCAWLGRSIGQMTYHHQPDTEGVRIKDASLLLAKGLHLGHSGQLLKGLLESSSGDVDDSARGGQIRALTDSLPAYSRRTFTEHLLRWLSSAVMPDTASNCPKVTGEIAAIAGLLSTILKGTERMLQEYLADPALSSTLSLPLQRACLAVLADDSEQDPIQNLLEKLISTFSSTIFIAHAPIAQQESLARSILIAAGYMHHQAPMSLLMTARSSGYMQGVSNRLDSSNIRARWLGMVVGGTLSKLVDKPGSQMDFGTEEMKSDEAERYAELVKVNDTVGTFGSFQALLQVQEHLQQGSKPPRIAKEPSKKTTVINGKPVFGPPRPPPPVQTKIVGERVTEILDDASDDEDDLKPYAKPDSDPEDSDEDATLVNRNKAKAPVYIRDLMAGLRDDKDYDRFNLAINTAAQLIRRKASFGKEVKDHAEELAGMLCNLQDPFDTDGFDDMRLQALVAVLLSDVKVIAPLLSRQAFAEGYSIAQRCVMLSALGLGGRELAGFKIEDKDYNPKLSNTDFASKKLPPRLHTIYGPSPSSDTPTKRLEAASRSIEHQIIQPMALQAADQSTAHLNAVKVRTFSSRMDVEKARTKRKPPANELAKCFGECFFFPLANRYQQEIAAYDSGSVYASAPFVLVTFIKTLALLIHASGPATLGLPQMSAEMWNLLLSLRVQAISDISILQAVLFALLTLLEINTDKQRIVQEHPKQLIETQQWVDLVFERMGSSGLVDNDGKSEEAKVRTLAAGVLMKCRDIVEAYQKQLVGYDFR